MRTFKDFLRWFNRNNVFPTLEAMQKMVDVYHNKGIDILKLGYTLPNLANMYRHGWWTIHSIYKESCCGRDCHSGFDKLVEVHCRK